MRALPLWAAALTRQIPHQLRPLVQQGEQHLDRAVRLGFACLVAAYGVLAAGVVHASASYPITATVGDGDGLDAVVQVWPDWSLRTGIRLAGINAPESQRGQATVVCRDAGLTGEALDACRTCELAAGERAKAALAALVEGATCTLNDPDPDASKYSGRVSGVVICNGVDVGAALIEQRFAVLYAGERRQPWAGCADGH